MNEDPNGCFKEVSEDSAKKETVFQDSKPTIHGEETTRESDQRGILQIEIKNEAGSVDNSKKPTCGEMQDFIHDSSKYSDAQGSSSGMAGQKRTLQTKGHFRSIAPKVSPSPVMTPASILPPSATISGISSGSNTSSDIQASKFPPKPIIMPARSYALMPVAGKEGTYSLVALPQVSAAPSQAPLKVDKTSITCTGQPQVSKACRSSVVSFGKTIPQGAATEKLPIPRYQSVWAKPAMKQRGASKLAVVKPSNLHCLSRATSVQVQPTPMPGHPQIHPSVVAPKTGLLAEGDKVALGAADATVSATLPRDADVIFGHSSTSKSDKLKTSEINQLVSLTVSTSMNRSTLNTATFKDSFKSKPDLLTTACSLSSWSVVQSDQQSPLISKQNRSVGSLPIMQFGNSVQFIAPSPAPKGKVPILPYSQVKRTIFLNPKQNQAPMEPSTQFMPRVHTANSGNDQSTDVPKNICVVSDFHRVGAQKPRSQLTFIPAERVSPHTSKKVIINRLKRPSSRHRLARKRKITENVAICKTKRFQTCDLSKAQEGKEKTKCDSSQECGTFKVKEQSIKTMTNKNSDKTAAVLKKFCNIMPKPVAVMQAVAPLAFSGGIVAVQNHDSLKSGAASSSATISKIGNFVQAANTSPYCRNLPEHLDEQAYKCNVCNRGFHFKHHLQDHLNIHSKSRPYCCRICHKAYSHSGSLSTHMKRCHSELRRKKLMCCEFCAKLFGNIGVYFFHLKEIHKVLISDEPSNNLFMQNKNNQSGKTEQMETMRCLPPSDRKQAEGEQSGAEVVVPGALQIKCARCQIVTPTFVDMKLHLLCVHEEELQLRVEEGSVKEKSRCISGFPICSRAETEQELFKHAANYWKQFGEKKNLVKCGICEEAFHSCFKLKKHMVLHYKQQLKLEAADSAAVPAAVPKVKKLHFLTNVGFNCILCKQKCGSKSELFRHWQSYHKCKDPAVLWTVFSSLIEHCRIDEEQTEVSPEHTAVSTEHFCRHIADATSLCDLHEGRRVVDQCKVHLSNCTGGTEKSLDSCQLTCPFCSKTFFCTTCRSSSSEEVIFHQEDVVHQCPKCLLKSPLTAKGLGAQVFCTSSKHCG
ncbi:zinc finger protein 438 isoform X2 [Pristis pectinata]|nr:zinc finger protein 438 isoform X2 [Pristis pectinata]XP_051872503.1 zinc finger protein 438 isoform X2 [Pristis pectinata]XP_051872504.1 zinc finger protein 438 isoform X2 [Pristis pectinata]